MLVIARLFLFVCLLVALFWMSVAIGALVGRPGTESGTEPLPAPTATANEESGRA